jgi:sigma-E factor negative regulatory protein RseB
MPALRRPGRALLLAALAMLAWPALAADRATAGAAAPAAADARAWLARLHGVAHTASYQGTLVFSAGGVMSSTRVWHHGVGGQSFERRENLDGRPQTVLRHNDTVLTYWPQSGAVLVERGRTLPVRGGAAAAVEPRALDHYELRREGSARVAGREADVIVLAPRDGLRYAHRLWADRASGLLLRADVLAPDQTVLESAAFSTIDIGVRPQPDAMLREMRRLQALPGARELASARVPADLQAKGWTLSRPVAGFELASCVLRSADAAEPRAPAAPPAATLVSAGATAEAAGPADGPVLQAVFHDGLTHVSLFIEPFHPQRHREAVAARMGATSTVMQRRDRHWVTAMGDVPPQTLRLFIDALQRTR